MKKIQSDRGETLVEVLASILISALSVALLFGCVMASSNMDRDAKELDGKHYDALTAAEAQNDALEPGITKQVEITNAVSSTPVKLNIEIYGGAGMYSYKRADE